MKSVLSLLCVALLLSACGEQEPPQTTTDPKTAPTTTDPGTTGSKWTTDEISTQSQYCSEVAAKTYYPQATWLKFCTCVYKAAATYWTYDEFFAGDDADFQTKYATLYDEGSVPACLTQAGMTRYLQ
jgi:hypothetical protein